MEPPTTRPSPPWSRWATILALAFALRGAVAFVLLGRMPLVHDAQSYLDFAIELLTDFPGKRAYYWPPGNSLAMTAIFAVTGPSVFVARALMLLFAISGVVLTALLARHLDTLRGARAERLTGFVAALYMPAVMLAGQTYAQHLSALSFVALAYLGLRAMREGRLWLFATAGAALGIGVLTRPAMISVAPVLLVVWALELRRRRRADDAAPRGTTMRLLGVGVFAVIAASALAPAIVHNARSGAGLTISTNNERNLFLGNNPYTPSYKTSHLGQRSLDELEPATQAYLRSFYERPDARAAMQSEAVSYMFEHPAITARRMFNRTTSFWGFDYLASRIIQEHHRWGKKALLPMLGLEAGAYVLVVTLALVGIFALRQSCDAYWRGGLLALALAYELPYVLAFSGGTYHFPVVPLLMPFAGVSLAAGRAAWPLLRASKWTWLALAVFVAIQIQYAFETIVMSG